MSPKTRFVLDRVDGAWVAFDLRGGGVAARFGSHPTREGIVGSLVGTLSADGWDARDIAAQIDGVGPQTVARHLGED